MNEQEIKHNSENIPESINAIDRLRNFLGDREKIRVMYEKLVNNKHVQESGVTYPTVERVIQYFELTLKGIEYARVTYGDEAVPANFSMMSGTLLVKDKKEPNFIGYDSEKDAFQVSFLHAAIHAEGYDGDAFVNDFHMSPNDCVRVEDETVLQAIEESYHSYQYKSRNLPPGGTVGQRDHPLEKEITGVFEKAIQDLGIKIYRRK